MGRVSRRSKVRHGDVVVIFLLLLFLCDGCASSVVRGNAVFVVVVVESDADCSLTCTVSNLTTVASWLFWCCCCHGGRRGGQTSLRGSGGCSALHGFSPALRRRSRVRGWGCGSLARWWWWRRQRRRRSQEWERRQHWPKDPGFYQTGKGSFGTERLTALPRECHYSSSITPRVLVHTR